MTTPTDDARLPGTYLSTSPHVTPEEAHAAAVTIAEHARDAEDARALLEALGLVERPEPDPDEVMPCGHPRRSFVRMESRNGLVCRECRRGADRIYRARERRHQREVRS